MDGIKKTAIFLSGLDWKLVDLLLNRLDDEVARDVRREMMSMNTISHELTQKVTTEFLHASGFSKRQTPKIAEQFQFGNQHINRLHCTNRVAQYVANNVNNVTGDNHSAATYGPPHHVTKSRIPQTYFDFLRHWKAGDVAIILSDEHPQTIAVVLAHLPGKLAKSIHACLPHFLQQEIESRLSDFDMTDEDILYDIESALQKKSALYTS
ncbi:MAG: hypothetical protein ACRCUY_02385 [Thermoguttaceae bacterium]